MKMPVVAAACLLVGGVAGYGVSHFTEPAGMRVVPPLDENARDATFTRATQIIDMMIANRHITYEGLNEAHALLRETGQADRTHELQSRIAVAVNLGELTPEQAGFGSPG